MLESRDIVRRFRSEGDHRRTYVTLVPEALDGIAVGGTRTAPRVVFVCSRNSARSQLAAALWPASSQIPATSAGTQPAEHIHPRALAAARRHGLRIPARKPCHLTHVTTNDDLVVAVCDRAHEELGELRRLHWSIPDPVRIDTDDAFDDAVLRLRTRITRLAGTIRSAPTPEGNS